MGKVQILAVLTMDGCLSSELYDKAHQDLCLDRCGLDEIRKKAFYRVTPDYSISMLHCGCTLWMKSYYTPFLSYPEADDIFLSRLCQSNTGRFPL